MKFVINQAEVDFRFHPDSTKHQNRSPSKIYSRSFQEFSKNPEKNPSNQSRRSNANLIYRTSIKIKLFDYLTLIAPQSLKVEDNTPRVLCPIKAKLSNVFSMLMAPTLEQRDVARKIFTTLTKCEQKQAQPPNVSGKRVYDPQLEKVFESTHTHVCNNFHRITRFR